MPLNAVSLFSGCGGFDWGATQSGINIIWANDFDADAASAYRSILPNVPFTLGDVRDVRFFPKADVLIGCYPCTGFSIAARRRAQGMETRNLLETEGNFLYKEFLRALKQVKPRYFFVENVSGMVSALQGWFFKQQLEGFKELGYVAQAKLLKALDYGLAQDRRRIFIVGVREDIAKEFTYQFPKSTHGEGQGIPYKSMHDVLTNMPVWPVGDFSNESFHGHYLTRNRKRRWDQPSFTIVANSSHVPLHPMGEPMVNIGVDQWALQGDINRRLSWAECRKLQGLPDHLLPDSTLKGKYKVVGNAVPPLFAQVIMDPIIDFEKNK